MLWLMFSTDSSFRSMKPWSPPEKAAVWGAEALGPGLEGTVFRSSLEGGTYASGLPKPVRW